jgi:molybdate transport system permease protein
MLDALILSLKVAGLCALLNLIPAVFVGWLLARKTFVGKSLLNGLVHLPLVMPPVTTGYLLLYFLGSNGFIGSFFLNSLGIRLAFSQYAAILASAIVSFPLFTRAVRVAIEMADFKLEQAAWTLGASRMRTFFEITIPQAFPGILSGLVLSFARSFGEFGATITFAGNIEGETRTIPLAIYSFMQVPGMESQAMNLVMLSVVVSFVALFASEWLFNKERQRKDQYNES